MSPPTRSNPRRADNATGAEVITGQADHDEFTAPHLSAEVAVCGALMLSEDARAGVPTMLDQDDFDRPAHRTLYRTILPMIQRGDHVDNITVNAELAKTGRLDEVGGLGAVWHCTSIEGCSTPSAWPTYCTIVVREARRRRGIAKLQRAIARLEAGADPQLVAAELGVAA